MAYDSFLIFNYGDFGNYGNFGNARFSLGCGLPALRFISNILVSAFYSSCSQRGQKLAAIRERQFRSRAEQFPVGLAQALQQVFPEILDNRKRRQFLLGRQGMFRSDGMRSQPGSFGG